MTSVLGSKKYMKISIITPAHNEEQYIGKALTAFMTIDFEKNYPFILILQKA